MPFVLTRENSLANQFLLELRDKDIQADRLRFRENLERLGSIMAYEISKTLKFSKQEIVTPLAVTEVNALAEQPVLLSILRAGIPFYQGFQKFFDKAQAGFIGAYRVETSPDDADGRAQSEITINLEYLATPDLEGKCVILVDPMLATGKSVIDVMNAVLRNGKPAHVHVASVVATPVGIEFVRQNLKVPHSVWTVAVDESLNDQFYIVPGLGDAGDLSFGPKM